MHLTTTFFLQLPEKHVIL